MSEGSPPVVLVVEDDENLADFYARWLAEEYEVRTAYGGREGLDRYDGDVDVVLLDRRMPELSGDEVLERIRETPHDCRVAMVTAVNPELDILEMEFDDYLVKPVSKDDLLRTVDELLALTAYDERVREYYALSAKRTTLMENKPSDEIERSEEYESLMERLADVQTEFAELREELDYEQLQNAFRIIDFEALAKDERRVDEG
jgi:DNA-binding response OmpR family regulator